MTSPSQNTAFSGSSEERSGHRGDYRNGKVETGLVQGSCAPRETLSKSLLPMGCAKARLSFRGVVASNSASALQNSQPMGLRWGPEKSTLARDSDLNTTAGGRRDENEVFLPNLERQKGEQGGDVSTLAQPVPGKLPGDRLGQGLDEGQRPGSV